MRQNPNMLGWYDAVCLFFPTSIFLIFFLKTSLIPSPQHTWVLTEPKTAQLRLALCDPVDWSPPVSSAHGILQARIL